MGYNTRRKSLSLAELGITLPKRSRTQSHPSPPNTIVEGDESERPSKKSRLMSPPKIKEEKQKSAAQLSPPPSPAAEGRNKVDVEGIGDDIVVGTIQQLEQTGNRPHLVKELAAVLATTHHSVEKSANPSALISSRLTTYLNRLWPAISPCPLAKDLSPVHPRRLYFYLTTMPRQPIPETVEPLPKNLRIISPSLSSASAADEEDERYTRTRQALSPSPEVDLSSPELDDQAAQEPPTPGAPFSGRNSAARSRSASAPDDRRASRPQLEHEEKDFQQIANALNEQAQQQRRDSQQSQEQQQDVNMEAGADASTGAEQDAESVSMSIEDESEEHAALANSDDVSALFGQVGHLKPTELDLFSSPVIQPQQSLQLDEVVAASSEVDDARDAGVEEPMALELSSHLSNPIVSGSKDMGLLADDWDDTLQSPENVELAELEDMFDAY